jgi:hypothetical protein
MKKIDLLHTTILIMALLCGYSALQTIVTFLMVIGAATEIRDPGSTWWSTFLGYLVEILAFIAAMIILVRNGRRYAGRLLGDREVDQSEASPALQADRADILFVLFVGMGLYMVIQALPYALQHLFELFQSKVSAFPGESEGTLRSAKHYLIYELLRITVGIALTYGAANLANIIENSVAHRLKGNPKTP